MLILLDNEYFHHIFLPMHHTVPNHDALIFSDLLAFLTFPLSLLHKGLEHQASPKNILNNISWKVSHPILRIKWSAKSYVRPEISHTHKLTNYE